MATRRRLGSEMYWERPGQLGALLPVTDRKDRPNDYSDFPPASQILEIGPEFERRRVRHPEPRWATPVRSYPQVRCASVLTKSFGGEGPHV
jgi:hypothetical protein